MIEPFQLIPPPDDTPPSPPGFPQPLRDSGSQALVGLAMASRMAIVQSISRVAMHYPQPATDVTGRSYLVLGTANVAISRLVGALEAGPPFSISVFKDSEGVARWLPSPSSLLAYDGDFWFAPFQPTLDGTPISTLTAESARVIPEGGMQAWLRIRWEPDVLPAVPGEPIYPVVVKSVRVIQIDFSAEAPADDIVHGITHRPWFTIGPEVDGAREVIYQTLGYCHFWLFIRGVSDSSSSSSSESSSSSGSPPSHQACFGVRMGGRLVYPTWGLILRPTPILRHTLTIALTPGESLVVATLPPEWLGSIEAGSTRIIHAHATLDTDAPVVATVEGGTVAVRCSRPLRKRQRRLIVQIEGLLAGHDGEYHWTDGAGREHNHKFWSTTP